MQFEHATLEVEIDELAKEYTYHVFYPKNSQKPDAIEDPCIFTGTDYATSVACKDKEELDTLLDLITEEDYQILQDEFDYDGIHVAEVNGIFLVSLEVDYLSEVKCQNVLNKYIVVGSQCDDICLLDLMPYRKAVVDGVFEDRELEDLDDFYQEDFLGSEEEYAENGKEEEYEEFEMSIDSYLRILEYCGNGSQKEKLDYILDQLRDYLIQES